MVTMSGESSCALSLANSLLSAGRQAGRQTLLYVLFGFPLSYSFSWAACLDSRGLSFFSPQPLASWKSLSLLCSGNFFFASVFVVGGHNVLLLLPRYNASLCVCREGIPALYACCVCVYSMPKCQVGVCVLLCLCLCVGRRACMCEFVHLWLWLCWVSAGRLCFPPVPVCGGNAEWRLFLWSVPELSRGGGRMEVWGGGGGGGFSTPVSTSTDLGHTSLSACFLFLRLSLYQFFSPSFLSFSDSLACLCLLSFPTPSLALCLIQYWFTTTTSSTSTTTTPSHKPDPSIQSTQDLTNGSWLPVIWQAVAYERCNKAGNSSLAVS